MANGSMESVLIPFIVMCVMQDVRSKTSQNTFDLGGATSNVVMGVTRYNSFDSSENLIAVNVRPGLTCEPRSLSG